MKFQSAESENIEYKESLAEKDDAGAAICSIANKKGGSVYFGIKNNSEIMGLGTISEKTIRDISNLYFDNLDPKVMMEITAEEKNILKLSFRRAKHLTTHINGFHIFVLVPLPKKCRKTNTKGG